MKHHEPARACAGTIALSLTLLLTMTNALNTPLNARNTNTDVTVQYLWPDGLPESNGITAPEINEAGRIENVTVPTMAIYPAKGRNTGVALVVCPGGAYIRQAAEHEGTDIANWLADNGITAILLKYRLPNGHAFIPGKDALRAIERVRQQAATWGIQPDKIGICGFSAGGHLAATAGTLFTGPANRPDFVILFYPVISMHDNITHRGSRENLLGSSQNDPDSVAFYSLENRVSEQTPPTLLLHSDDDRGVVPENSLRFYRALKAKGVPASLHIYPEGGHGWGFRPNFRYHETWIATVLDWLKQRRLI